MSSETAFQLNDATIRLADTAPTESLLRWLNRHGLNGTKEGCADGDCGACTVAMVDTDADGARQFRAVNSCLLPMGAVVGREVITVEHLAEGDRLHPVQRAMADNSGSQCGYCTPGFVMSLFAGFYAGELDDRTTEGNLCRCTGYAPIRRATADLRRTAVRQDRFVEPLRQTAVLSANRDLGSYFNPGDIDTALELKQRHADACWIAGATDLGVELSHGRGPGTCIALDRIEALKQVRIDEAGITLGAGLSLSRIEKELAGRIPALDQMLRWFGARQVRNRATLGGNLGTASPIGDLLPVLLALDAEIAIQGPRGQREVAAADFFRAYRKMDCADDELIVYVRIPSNRWTTASYKVAKRQSDDISIVAAAFALGVDAGGRVAHARLAFGGVAAMPLRALAAETLLLGRRLDAETLAQCANLLRNGFEPLSDHRGSAGYRRELCATLFLKFVAEHGA